MTPLPSMPEGKATAPVECRRYGQLCSGMRQHRLNRPTPRRAQTTTAHPVWSPQVIPWPLGARIYTALLRNEPAQSGGCGNLPLSLTTAL